MHGLTPLGTMMHLKELDRQAASNLHALRSRKEDASDAVVTAVTALVRRLHAVGLAWRLVGQGQNIRQG
jgi:hypothetical protein